MGERYTHFSKIAAALPNASLSMTRLELTATHLADNIFHRYTIKSGPSVMRNSQQAMHEASSFAEKDGKQIQ